MKSFPEVSLSSVKFPWVTSRIHWPKVKGDNETMPYDCHSGRSQATHWWSITFLYLVEEETTVCEIDVFGVVCKDLSSNKCVWFLWVTEDAVLKLLHFFHVTLGLRFFFPQMLESIQFFSPALPFQKYESKYLEETSFETPCCVPYESSGCLSRPEYHLLVCRGGGGLPVSTLLRFMARPAPCSCRQQHSLRPRATSLCSAVVLTARWIKWCALFINAFVTLSFLVALFPWKL